MTERKKTNPWLSIPRKLDPWKVKEIRAKYAAGVKCSLIAAEYGINDSTAYKVATRISWRHIG